MFIPKQVYRVYSGAMMRISIKTFGCRLNQAESARFAAELEALGWQVVGLGKPAEVVLLHACAVTQTAESEVLRTARKLREHAFVALAGCVAPAALPRAREAADLVIAAEEKENLAKILTVAWQEHCHATSNEPVARGVDAPRFSTSRAWLKVQDGCNFRCAYCIVPDTRGEPRSRPLAECVREAMALLEAGHRELVVTGCNMACWREGRLRLPDLLRALAEVTRFSGARLRIGSLEPGGSEREVVDLVAEERVFCRFLHLPLQHADAGVLRAMRRRYTIGQYGELLEYARARIPGVGLGTDLITGFPGETEAAFGALRDFVAAHPFSNLHVFPYSERPGTPAAGLPDGVAPALRKARAKELIALGAWQRSSFATAQLLTLQRVLVEGVAGGIGSGWTDTYLACRIPGLTREDRGRIVEVTPVRVEGDVLWGG